MERVFFLSLFSILFVTCDSFMRASSLFPRPSEEIVLNRRLDESLAFLSFGLRSSLLPIPTVSSLFPNCDNAHKHSELEKGKMITLSEDDANEELDFPWLTSILPSRDLTYMPMLQDQLNMMRDLGMEKIETVLKFKEQRSSVKSARIHNLSFRNDKFRKVRMTYFDAGDNVQVLKYIFSQLFSVDFNDIITE